MNVVTLSLSGNTIDYKDINHKIEDFFSSNGINSKMSFFFLQTLSYSAVGQIHSTPASAVGVAIMFSTVHLSRIILFKWMMQKCLLSQSVCRANEKLRLMHELTMKQHSVLTKYRIPNENLQSRTLHLVFYCI